MGNVINGGDLMFFLNGKAVAFATNHKLSVKVETAETTSKDSGGKWVTKEGRKISWDGNTENLYSNDGSGSTFDDLFSLLVSRTPIPAVFSLKAEDTDTVPTGGWTPSATGKYSGNVIITSLEANAPNGENATLTCSFEGTGPLAKAQ